MLVKKIENCKNGIFILGINNVSISLINTLVEKKIKIFLWDANIEIIEEYKNSFIQSPYVEILNVNKFNFDKIDYFVLFKDILFDDDEYKTLIMRLDKIKEKVYIDIEFISELYPNNKYIALITSSYNFILNSLLENTFNYSDKNIINITNINDKNELTSNFVNFNEAICYAILTNNKVKYLKTLMFNTIAILDINEEIAQNKKLLKQRKDLVFLQGETSKIILNVDNKYIKYFSDTLIKDNNVKCKIIPISINKMLSNGVSYINNVIYNYYNNNTYFDVKQNEYLLGDINKTSILISFIVAYDLEIDYKIVLETLNLFKGVKNYLEYVEQYKNIKFINNIGANNDMLLLSPFETYNNIYAIFVINGKHIDHFNQKEKYNKKNIKKIFIIDLLDLVNVENDKIFRFKKLEDAFKKVMEEVNNEEKEKEITVLLSPIIGEQMNIIYYSNYGDEFRSAINSLNK